MSLLHSPVSLRLCAGVFFTAMFVAGSAFAGTSCVNMTGSGGCFDSIQNAINAASPGDTINVAAGSYYENVVIQKSLSLIGSGTADSPNTIIDAQNNGTGINVDGMMGDLSHLGGTYLRNITVSGFEVQNAQTQGILVTNASHVTLSENHVHHNNKGLQSGPPPFCTGLPIYFQAGESFDCGEGIHLSGVSHSSVINNRSESNAGGILLSDDTGQTHDNLVMGNTVEDNGPDCGITLASHNIPNPPYFPPPPGVFHNMIIGNISRNNAINPVGDGAGVGIFAAAPGARNYGNTIAHNTLTDNNMPGVTMHAHAPGQYVDNNHIVGNTISGNGPDGAMDSVLIYPSANAPTGIVIFSPVVPVNGTMILDNDISGESIDISIAGAGFTNIHQNSLLGDGYGIENFFGAGATVNGLTNWWGCKQGPGQANCTAVSGNVNYAPWLKKSPARITGNHGNHGKP